MTDFDQFWPLCLSRFQTELSAQQFNTWIKPLHCEVKEQGLVLYAPNRFVLQFIKERFFARIETFAEEAGMAGVEIELRIATPASAPKTPPSRLAPARVVAAPAILTPPPSPAT